jgi:D-aminoacyl-tRNA deacylase
VKTVIVCSLNDSAGTNIRERLIEKFDFRDSGQVFEDSPIYEADGVLIVSSSREIIFVDGLDERLGQETRYVFASRHVAESGIPSLTAHFTGNFGEASFGGKDREISYYSPALLKNYMTALFSKRNKIPDSYNITIEATHHGPTSLRSSVLFVELGSTDVQWEDTETAGFIAESIMEAIRSERSYEKCGIGIGGTHYPEKLNKIVLDTDIAIGPAVPKYSLEYFDAGMVSQILEKSDQKITAAIIDQKGLGKFKENVTKVISESGLERINV